MNTTLKLQQLEATRICNAVENVTVPGCGGGGGGARLHPRAGRAAAGDVSPLVCFYKISPGLLITRYFSGCCLWHL